MAKRASWSEVSPVVAEAALSCCRGVYQRGIVQGSFSLSGSTLQGKARSYGARYYRSAIRLIGRMRAAGLHVNVRTAENGARILTIFPDFIGEGI